MAVVACHRRRRAVHVPVAGTCSTQDPRSPTSHSLTRGETIIARQNGHTVLPQAMCEAREPGSRQLQYRAPLGGLVHTCSSVHSLGMVAAARCTCRRMALVCLQATPSLGHKHPVLVSQVWVEASTEGRPAILLTLSTVALPTCTAHGSS